MSALLDVQDLSVTFHSPHGLVEAVRGVSFSLQAGEVLAIVGESGCGKSVLCKSIMKLLPESAQITGGRILLKGMDITGYTEREMRRLRGRAFSMLFQDPMTALAPTMTIGRQIGEAVLVHRPRLPRAALRRRVAELLDLVGLDPAAARLCPYALSGGMRQRSVLAVALASEPSLLFADEPTTALDVTTQAQIIELFKDLQHKLHTSIVFISHDLGVIGEISDHIAVLYAGYVMEECGVKTLFQNPLHPYTFGLMSSRMGRTLKNKDKLYSIPGIVPSAENMPAGCPFAPRCARAGERCANAVPPLREIEPGHKVRCWEVAGHE